MHEEWDFFIIRSRLESAPWMYWTRTELGYIFTTPVSDEKVIRFTRQSARNLVKHLLDSGAIWSYYQIRPYECDVNDPRIEDYQAGKTYDWSASFPHLTARDDIPEILITISGGLIDEIHTTLPRLFINVIDRDNEEVGDDPVTQYELSGSFTGVSADVIHQLVGEVQAEYDAENTAEEGDYDAPF